MKLILLVLLLLLIVSLGLNYYFYKKTVVMFSSRLDPIGLNYYPDTFSVSQSDAKSKAKIMFYGDSRALSWATPKLDQYDVINRAIGGQTSIQIASRFQQHVVAHQPDIIILQLCVNDLKMVPLLPKQEKEIIDNCKNNLLQIIQQAHKIKAKVIVSTIFPLADISIIKKIFGFKEIPIMKAIDDVNVYIHTLASDNTVVFDAYGLLKGEGQKIDARYARDWLHLNVNGYEMLNKRLVRLLKKK